MNKIKDLRDTRWGAEMKAHEIEAIKRAESFPVKGGDIVPVRRKSWYKTVDQKSQAHKTR